MAIPTGYGDYGGARNPWEDSIETWPSGLGAPPPPPAPTAVDAPAPAPSVGGGGGGGGNTWETGMHLPGLPQFEFSAFRAPSMQEAQNDPGYQFRLQAGQDALQRSAAARGLTRTGGTLKDLVNYSQNFATQEYGNVFGRAKDVYDRYYQGERDKFAPRMAEYQNLAGYEKAAALARLQGNISGSLQSAQNSWQASQNNQAPPPQGPPTAPPSALPPGGGSRIPKLV